MNAPVNEWADQIEAIARNFARHLNLDYEEFRMSSGQDLNEHVEGWLMGAWDAVVVDKEGNSK